jgi:hypothetical protein
LKGLKKIHFFYGATIVSVVKNVESVSRLRVAVFDAALLLFIEELEVRLVWPTYSLLHVMKESE